MAAHAAWFPPADDAIACRINSCFANRTCVKSKPAEYVRLRAVSPMIDKKSPDMRSRGAAIVEGAEVSP
jgi:hypothetical protein